MSFSRRDLLKLLGATTAVSVTPPFPRCRGEGSPLTDFQEVNVLLRKGQSCAGNDLFDGLHQLRMGSVKRLKVVKQWIEHNRLDENNRDDQRYRNHPKP